MTHGPIACTRTCLESQLAQLALLALVFYFELLFVAVKFLFGGTAGMAATLFVQPLDLVKNRMQVTKTPTLLFTR
jgi:hypothetical protein